MLVTHSREKLLNAIIFFLGETRSCHKMKVFKLLFLLDFEVYRQTGKSVTGLSYFAWPMGPVPSKLFEELKSPASDFQTHLAISIGKSRDDDFGESILNFRAKKAFDSSWFSARELSVMNRLAEIFKDATAQQMSAVTHVLGSPWHQVFEIEKNKQGLIPYVLAIDGKSDSISREVAKLIEDEELEAARLFG